MNVCPNCQNFVGGAPVCQNCGYNNCPKHYNDPIPNIQPITTKLADAMPSERERISKPTLEHLADYLHYQYPATSGDILLNELCEQVKSLKEQKERAEAACGVMRKVIQDKIDHPNWNFEVSCGANKALSTTCGQSLLDENKNLKEAAKEMVRCADYTMSILRLGGGDFEKAVNNLKQYVQSTPQPTQQNKEGEK